MCRESRLGEVAGVYQTWRMASGNSTAFFNIRIFLAEARKVWVYYSGRSDESEVM